MRTRKDLVETRFDRPLSLILASSECADSTSKGITSFTSSSCNAIEDAPVTEGILISLSCADHAALIGPRLALPSRQRPEFNQLLRRRLFAVLFGIVRLDLLEHL